jgi:magnesium chelatase subunit D
LSVPGFPFSAIVGQEALREALLVNAVSPDVGGVLVRGERGTAKSTAVRALAPLLPSVPAAVGQSFCFAPGDLAPDGIVDGDAPVEDRPAPLVELPVGATIDRLVGALDLGRALAGERAFEAGLLARAHRGVLYVDEVNLLPDHLVDVLLDAAAMGVCHVERDAVSVRHDARFLLVGTMNAEEGELRPQLLDRFGLGVEVAAPADPVARAEIVRRRLAYEADPVAFAVRFADADADVAASILAARERLALVRLPERELDRIVRACAEIGVDGMRGDVVTARTARVLAALDGASEVDADHVRRAAHLALAHRRRRDPLGGAGDDPADIDRALDADSGPDEPDPPPPPRGGGAPSPDGTDTADAQGGNGRGPTADAAPERVPEAPDLAAPAPRDRLDAAARMPPIELPRPRAQRAAGEPIDSRAAAGDDDLALVATLRERLATGDATARRANVRAGRDDMLLCLVIDASGSMAARRRMEAVKGAVLSLLLDAYQRRDKVGLVCFRGAGAELLLPPTSSVDAAARRLETMPAGGRTPLAAGLAEAHATLRRERLRDPLRRPLLVLVTDGRHTAGGEPSAAAANLRRDGIASVVVDCESGPVRLGLAAGLAQALGAEYLSLGGLSAGTPGTPGTPAAPGPAGRPGLSAELLAGSVRGWRAGQGDRKVA